jgi:hypothetical protein
VKVKAQTFASFIAYEDGSDGKNLANSPEFQKGTKKSCAATSIEKSL